MAQGAGEKARRLAAAPSALPGYQLSVVSYQGIVQRFALSSPNALRPGPCAVAMALAAWRKAQGKRLEG